MLETKRYPDFFVVGAQKSGTTTLYGLLRQHPSLFLSDQKETHYFSHGLANETFQDNASSMLNASIVRTENEYLDRFRGAEGKVIGEVCPTYLYSKNAASEIHLANPNAKIIVLLREHVDRAYSAYMHMKARGAEVSDSFLTALEKENTYIDNQYQPLSHYISGSKYFQQIERYKELFGLSNIMILKFTDLENDSISSANRVLAFLGLNGLPRTTYIPQKNQTFIPKKGFVGDTIKNKPFWLMALREMLPKRIRGRIFENVKKRYSIKQQPLSLEDRGLAAKFFLEDKKLLSEVYNVNFDSFRGLDDRSTR